MASSFPLSSSLLLLFLIAVPTTVSSYTIDNICKKTRNKTFCLNLLQPHRDTTRQDLGQIVVKTTTKSASRTSAKIKSLLSKTSDESLRNSYGFCLSFYTPALGTLAAAKDKLKSGQYRGLRGLASTVSREAASCHQAFTFAPGKPILIKHDNANFEQLSEIFDVIARLLSGSKVL